MAISCALDDRDWVGLLVYEGRGISGVYGRGVQVYIA